MFNCKACYDLREVINPVGGKLGPCLACKHLPAKDQWIKVGFGTYQHTNREHLEGLEHQRQALLRLPKMGAVAEAWIAPRLEALQAEIYRGNSLEDEAGDFIRD
jgi:hypothetical protein